MAHPDVSTLDYLVDAFVDHARRTRGLRDRTLQGYARIARLLIRDALGKDPIDVRALRLCHVGQFVRAMAGRFSPCSMKTVGTALRAFFRFLRVEGFCNERLEIAIPLIPRRRHATLPRCLSDKQLQLVLASFDASTPCGLRDRAIVVCLSALGLRPGEVAALRLDDIDWRHGNIRLRTRKTRRGAVLPLPRDAGRAIVDYLRRERPKTCERRLFVQHLGRRRGVPISSGVVSAAVCRALRRAQIEVPMAGAYIFRHTVASRMVRRGTSLKEVADLLGHCCLDTTTIYAKLDVSTLHDVALPWPEVTP